MDGSRNGQFSKDLTKGLMQVEYRLKPSELSELGSEQRLPD